jgi:mono/diheme cytochrome c family protein
MPAMIRSVILSVSILLCLRLWAQPSSIESEAPLGNTLVFDAETKQYNASPGEATAPFVFNLTNVWTNEIVITGVKASCGCTTASMPAVPWHIPPAGEGQIHAQVNLAGKGGLVTKTLTFSTSIGTRLLFLKVNIPIAPASGGALSESERRAAMARAVGDPQAIFKGDCVSCHVEKGRNAHGETLYVADCGICHESSHREKIVPDLHALKQETDLAYWKQIITSGKPHTLMPAFSATQGGPLTDDQIASLANYLNHVISHNFSLTMTNAANVQSAPRQVIQ